MGLYFGAAPATHSSPRTIGKVSFDYSGFEKLSFRQHGVMEEGLALVFKPKDVTPKSVQRIGQAVRDVATAMEAAGSCYLPSHVRGAEYRLGQAMKRLCAKIGQLDTISGYRRLDEADRALMRAYGGGALVAGETLRLADHALELIRCHAPRVFSERAKELLERTDKEVLV